MEVVRTLPTSLPSLPLENLGRELFPIGRDPILPGQLRGAAGGRGDESAKLAEELCAAARRAAESAEVRFHPLAVLLFMLCWLRC